MTNEEFERRCIKFARLTQRGIALDAAIGIAFDLPQEEAFRYALEAIGYALARVRLNRERESDE